MLFRKKLETQLQRAREIQIKAQNNFNSFTEAQAKMHNRTIEKELRLQQMISNKELEKKDLTKAQNHLKILQGDLEYQQYKAATQAVNKAKQQVEVTEERLEQEEQVEKILGKTGAAMKFLSQNLNIGKDAYAKMVLEAREGETTTKKWILTAAFLGVTAKAAWSGVNKIASGFSEQTKKLAENEGPINKLFSPLTGLVSQIPLIGGLLGSVLNTFTSILDVAVGIDDRIVKAGRNLGLTSPEAAELNKHFQDVSYNAGNIFITSKKLLESQLELNKEMGVNVQLSDEQLETNTMLKDLAGLELDTRTAITNTSIITGKTENEITKGVLAQVAGLKSATGISFNYQKTLKEAANQSGYLGLQFAKYPDKLTKSLLTVKALGMDLKQLDSIADSFLDFESSISKEFEAQLLTGKQINLQKARELFLNNDLAGAAMEINKQIGSSKDFLKLNRIAAESLAGALGMSRDQLGDMLQKQELYSKIGAKEGTSQRELLRLGLERYKNQKLLSAAIGEEAYQSLVTGSTQEKMAATIEKIKQSIVDFVEKSKIIEKIQGFVDYMSRPENIKGILGTIKNSLANFVEFVGAILADITVGVSHLPFTDKDKWLKRAAAIEEGASSMSQGIRSVGGGMSMTPETVAQSAASTTTGGQAKAAAVPQGQFSKDRIVINNVIEVKQDSFSTEKTRMSTQTMDPGLNHSDNSSNPTYKK